MSRSSGITADRIAATLGGNAVLHGVSLEVGPSEIHALVGLNGAGKTTLLRTLLGMLRPESGRATIRGNDVATMAPHEWARVGQMLETPFAYPELTASENVYASARLHGLGPGSASAATTRAIEALGIDAYADRRARILSTGNRQRVGLAAALVHAPSVIILDEPSNGLDPRGVIVLRRLLQAAAKNHGASVLVSSHHLDEVARIADTITVLHRGSIIGTLQPGAVDLERAFFDLVLEADSSLPEDEPA